MIPLLFRKRSRLWTPRDLPNFNKVELWLDPKDRSTISLNGSTVSQVSDKSNFGRNATQGSASFQPGYDGNSLTFEGTDDFLQHNAVTFETNTNFFIVIKPISVGGSNRYLYSTRTASTNGFSLIRIPGFLLWDFGGSPTNRLVLSFDLVDNDSSVLSFQRTASGRVVRKNATITDSSANAGDLTIANSGGAVANISKDPSGSSSNFGGEIKEIILINGDITSSNVDRIIGYLSHRHSMSASLPSNFIYKNSPPKK